MKVSTSRHRPLETHLEEEYPRQAVAPHEVLISFKNDLDAEHFSSWWNAAGVELFAKWLAKVEGKK